MSQQLFDVAPTEDPGGGRPMPAHSIMAAVMELQSLVEWTAQRKGLKEDASVVNEKLRQLDKIRKELEKSARLQAYMTPSSEETPHTHSSADGDEKSKMNLLLSDPGIKSVQDTSDIITVPLICDDDTSYNQPVQDLKNDIHSYSVCAMEDSFHLEDIPPPIDECNCDSALEENNSDMYINFVSAKEKIDQLTMDLEIEEEVKSSNKVDSRHHATDEPDSLGTAISEDEGLGEESRRADSTGSNSFLDIHTSEEDLVEDPGAGAPSVHYVKEDEPSNKTDVWIKDAQDPRLSVELCRCTIYKLKECLKAKEEQLKRFRDEYKDNNQVKTLQTLVNNLKNEMEELKAQLKTSQLEKSGLHEQVLELEEAENDARRQCQRYEEKVLFLQEKDAHFQGEFVETRQALELCMSTLSAKDSKEKELRSQLKYTEVLVQKYEDQIKTLEASEYKLKQKMTELEEHLLKFQNSKSDILHKGTQTYPERAKTNVEVHGSMKTSRDCCEKQCSSTQDKIRLSKSRSSGSSELHDKHGSHRDETSSRKNSGRSLPEYGVSDTAQFTEIGIQVNLVKCTNENTTQTEFELQMCCESRSTTREVQTPSVNSSVASAVELSCESTSNTELDISSSLSSSCPFQQELFHRLHHLVEEDAHLQQQLHHMDQINLTLWQKLHNLEFHIGECKRENFQHHTRMDDEARTSDVTSPMNVLPPECSSNQLQTVKTQSLDAGREQHFVSSGKIINLDFNEDGLKDRLLRLEQINFTFEAELCNREKLYQKKEQKHKEWVEAEDRFTCDIRYLQMEKNTLLTKVTQLEAEKQRLTSKLLAMAEELSGLQERHRKQISIMTEEHEALVSELRSRIELLTKKEKEYVGQIANLRMEKKSSTRKEMEAGEKSELDNLKASYVQLQIELSQNRSNMTEMENEFEDRLKALKESHLSEEVRFVEELQQLREKEADFDEQLDTYQKRQSELEAALSDKEQQLEDARLEFKEQLLTMEEEHRTVETQLNGKLRQMEESTAVATKALTEEKVRLEKELQENLYDLRTKEEQYKSRIAELETDVSQLHVELRRLTGDLDEGFPECDGTEFPAFQKERLQKQLQELQRREGDLREKLEEMEQKEAAYRETLENADRIVASVERGYKNKIEELEMSERSLKQRVNHLEEIESKLRVALHRERRSSDGRKPDDLVLELLEAEVRENTLKERIETLEQSQRTTTHRLKELEKLRESLESKMADHEELVSSLDRLQQEHDISRKENAKLRISESGLRLALQQAEGMLKSREMEMRGEMQRMQEEKKELEETIHQLRMQVRQLQLLMDCNQEEEASGETLGETVQRSDVPENDAISKETEILEECGESHKSDPPTEGGQNATEEVAMELEKGRNTASQERCETSNDQLDERNTHADSFPAESKESSSEKHNSENVLVDADDDVTIGDSQEKGEPGEDSLSPTIEFFLPEPKKLKYELVETNIREMKSVQSDMDPLANTVGDTSRPNHDSSTANSLPKSNEQLHHCEAAKESSPEEAVKGEAAVESSQTGSSKPHFESTGTSAEVEQTVINTDKTPDISKESALVPDDPDKLVTENTTSEPSQLKDDSINLLPASTESVSNEYFDREISGTTNTVFLSSSPQLSSESLGANNTERTSTPDSLDDSRWDDDVDDIKQTCDIQLLHEEISAADLPSEGSYGMPADSILKLLRGLRPGSTALVPCVQSDAKTRTMLKEYSITDDVSAKVISQDGQTETLPAEGVVDWLKVVEETASRFAEEKRILEEEVKQLREKALITEKEKEVLKESLKNVEDLESLRGINSKLQEEVSLLEKRLKMGTPSDSVETKKGEEKKCLSPESIGKHREVKTEHKTDPTSSGSTEASARSSEPEFASGEMRPLTTTSPPPPPLHPPPPPPLHPPPPLDECKKERMQLEENMIRAMAAMQFDMQQKKAAKRFSPAYGSSDTSTRPKGPVAQGEVVAMGTCVSEGKEDRSTSSRPSVHSPFNFRVVQQVGSDTVLVGWEHAHPTELEGFEVYVNGTLHETVYTPDRTKAVISGLDLQQQSTLSVCAISRFGEVSEPQLLHLPLRDNNAKDGFFFSDEDDDDYDELFYVDEEIDRQTRPYSMEW